MIQRVHIEFQRVQTWLFSAPRLRAMVGANALLGEVLRVELPKLARQSGEWSLAPGEWSLAPDTESYLVADPLKAHDNPAADARDGILSRDGGHFEARFRSGAEAFAEAAGRCLRSDLPNLRFRISIDKEPLTKSRVHLSTKSRVHLSTELPVLAPCEWTGRGLASVRVKQGDERPAVSLDVAHRHEAAKRTENGTAVDIASLLGATTKLNRLKRVLELKDLVGSGYLSLIHADGNSVGSGAVGSGAVGSDSKRAGFFHRNRVLLRRATQKAINTHCPDAGAAPLIPLMLGGDDLLLVCRAEIALPFVVTLCATLDELQTNSKDFKLTLGVGVVFAKHTIPMHRLHEVAEQLASSAKRRFRGLKDGDVKRSIVDWAVFSTSWVDDPEEIRRRDWLRGNGEDRRVLSQRPVDVVGGGLNSLQGLVRGAANLSCAPRSQLRYLVDQLPRGRMLSKLAFEELSIEAKDALAEAGVKSLWQQTANNGPWLTALLDLVEIAEIARLGSGTEAVRAEGEDANG